MLDHAYETKRDIGKFGIPLSVLDGVKKHRLFKEISHLRYVVLAVVTFSFGATTLGSCYRDSKDAYNYLGMRDEVIQRSADLSRGGGCGKIAAEAFQEMEDDAAQAELDQNAH